LRSGWGFFSNHVNFQRNAGPILALFRGQDVEALEANDASAPVFHKNDIVVRFFTDMFLFGVVEPDAERITFAIEIGPYGFLIDNLLSMRLRSDS
jgi:hypothetical protein